MASLTPTPIVDAGEGGGAYTVRSRFSGSAHHPVYADWLMPARPAMALPVIMVHGGCNTGSCFLATSDGRPGWAHDFASAGIETLVIDWPGHGRSPARADFLTLSSKDVRDSLGALLDEIGPAILLGHSAAGPILWSLAETRSDLVAGLVGIAPGPPANLVTPIVHASPNDGLGATDAPGDPDANYPIRADETVPFIVDEQFVRDFWFSGSAAPANAAADFYRSVVPESPRLINERFNVAGEGLRVDDPALVARRPVLVVTPECDPRHPRAVDAATAELFGADHVWLPDHGLRGNSHMVMSDLTSQPVARLIIEWILQRC